MQRTGGRAKCGERQRETREGLRGSWACAGLRHLGRATWTTLTWAALTWAGLPGPRGGRRQSRAWLPRTVFVPRRSAFLWAGGAPCRPRRVARQSAQPRPRKARLGPARPLALQEKLRPRDGTAGPVQPQDRGRAPGRLCGRGCLPGPAPAGVQGGAERGPLPGRRPAPPAPRTASGQDSRGHAEGEQRRREVSRPGREDQRLAARSPSRGSPCPALPSFQIFLKKPENSDFYGNAPQFNSSSKQRRRGAMGLGHQPLAGAVPGVTQSALPWVPATAGRPCCGHSLQIFLHFQH